MNSLRLFVCLLLLTAETGVVTDSQAQTQPPGAPSPSATEVVGTSYILPASGPTITGYASTEIGSDLEAYYQAGVDATLTEAGASPTSGTGQGNPAEETLSLPSGAAMFELDSSHYLTPTSFEDCPAFDDPYAFQNAGGASGQGYIVVDAPGEFDDLNCTFYTRLDVGSTYWQEYGTAPQIQGISPNGVTLNSTGTLTITGLYLTAAGTDSNPTVTVVSGSGLTTGNVTIVSDNGLDVLDVGYTVDSSPNSTGQHGITVTTIGGTSNSVNVNVGDPTPAITSVSPNQWYAPSTNLITITGQGFGTNPCLQISPAPGVTFLSAAGCVTLSAATDTTMQATVTIDPNAPAGTSTITVQSQGYNANGFQQTQTGQSSTSNQQTANTIPVSAPSPYIVVGVDTGGTICQPANAVTTTQNVVVGQQIAFTACMPTLPQGVRIASESWTPNSPLGTAVAGYTASTAGGSVQLVSVTTCGTGQYCDFAPFYWVDQGLRQFTFNYTLANGNSSIARVSFSVSGPSQSAGTPYITATPGASGIMPGPYLQLGGSASNIGMKFSASATLPSAGSNAAYLWVQLVTNNVVTQITSTGQQTCPETALSTVPGVPGGPPVLDNNFPYVTSAPYASTTNDNPRTPLSAGVGERARDFSATMYLMWDPALPSDCKPAYNTATNNPNGTQTQTPVKSTCTASIPVPLANLTWHWKADAINTLSAVTGDTGTTWKLGCGSQSGDGCIASNPATDPNNSYPTWAAATTNGPFNQAYNCK